MLSLRGFSVGFLGFWVLGFRGLGLRVPGTTDPEIWTPRFGVVGGVAEPAKLENVLRLLEGPGTFWATGLRSFGC